MSFPDFPGAHDKELMQYRLYTQVKIAYALKLLGLPESECPTIWIRLPNKRRPKSWDSVQDPVVLLERTLF